MMNLSTLTVQKPVDNPRTSSSEPATAPDSAMLTKFQPEPWEPVPPHQERMILAGCGVLCAAILSLVGWIIYKALT